MFRSLKYFLLSAVAALAVTGCSADGDSRADQPDVAGGCTLRLFLDAGTGVKSRAPGGDDQYRPGESYENFIDIEGRDFRVMLFTADDPATNRDRWLLTVDPSANPDGLLFLPTTGYINSPEGSKRYRLEFKVSEDIVNAINGAHAVKVVILANWRGNYPVCTSATSTADLFDQAAEISYLTLPTQLTSKDDRIAMYGVSLFTGVTVRQDNIFALGDIHLLRSVAKIEVYDHAETLAPVSSVAITRHNTRAVAMPKNVTLREHYVKGTWNGDYVGYTSFHTPWNYESSTPAPLEKLSDGHFYIFVPEFLNVGRSEAERARLAITLSGETEPYYIDFLQDNKIIDILRNNWYRFEVKKSTPQPNEITVTVQVQPYAITVLKPGFGLDNGAQLVPIYDEDGQIKYWYDPDKNVYTDPDGNVVRPYEFETDPFTGYTYERDGNRQPFCFRDQVEDKFYLLDRVTEIQDPHKEIVSNLWRKIVTIEGKHIYWYDYVNSEWHDIEGNLVEYDENTSCSVLRYSPAPDKVALFSPITDKYYMIDGKSEILNPLLPANQTTVNGKLRLILKNPSGTVLYYYEPSTDTWFDASGNKLNYQPSSYPV